MKKILVVLLSFPLYSFANVGFICKTESLEISQAKVNNLNTLRVLNTQTGSESFNDHLVLPEGNSTDAYQERYGRYYEVLANAQANFPYMPEFMMFYHMSKSNSLYKKGFKAFEGEGQAVELPKMYCKAFVTALMAF
ncbi:MAG: hypothetical protein ACOYL6_18285 [Bacteriovoracaceae bacterium]